MENVVYLYLALPFDNSDLSRWIFVEWSTWQLLIFFTYFKAYLFLLLKLSLMLLSFTTFPMTKRSRIRQRMKF